MKTEWKRDAQHIWMILSGEDLAPPESWSFRILSGNRIPGLLPCRPSKIDQETKLYYDISGRHSLQDIMKMNGLSSRLLEKLLAALCGICEALEEYLLAAEGLLLSPDCIFMDPDGESVGFCYYPGQAGTFPDMLRGFSESLLPHLDQQDKTAVVMGYGLYQRSLSDELPRDILHDLLRRGTEQKPAPVTREELEQSALLDSFFAEEEEEESVFRKAGGRIRNWFRREPEDTPRTTLLQGPLPGSTQVARDSLEISLPDGRQETAHLEKDRYLIGKAGAGAGIELPSPAVSRMHAVMEKQENTYSVRDLHSRNGTFVNGEELLPEETRILKDGDTLQFADITCRYIIRTIY